MGTGQGRAISRWPKPGTDVNLHAHTFFSYNAYGYSPSKFAWLARKRGLAAAGIVDFDVLDALEEFWAAGKLLGLKRCASLESRVFVPEFATRVINSPGEPGIAYHMGVGFPREVKHPLLSQMRRTSEARNRELVRRVNDFLKPVGLDYDKDVLPLTPNGNATERHICEAYSRKGDAAFWKSKIGDCPADAGKFQALIRSKMMKKGGPGYVPAGQGFLPADGRHEPFRAGGRRDSHADLARRHERRREGHRGAFSSRHVQRRGGHQHHSRPQLHARRERPEAAKPLRRGRAGGEASISRSSSARK